MIDYSVLAIAVALCLLAGFVIWTAIKVQRLIRSLEEVMSKVEPEAFKLIKAASYLTNNLSSKLSTRPQSNWIQGALLGLKIYQTMRK